MSSRNHEKVLYHFIQFEQHVTFLFFRQISKIAINREKMIGGVKENWVWHVTFELNEMVQTRKLKLTKAPRKAKLEPHKKNT